MSTEQEQVMSTAGRKYFSPEVKKEAVRLLVEEKLTLDEVAAKIGCCVNSVQNWKAKYHPTKKSGSSEQASPAKGPKNYSSKVRKEAMRLLREGELSYQQIADKIGCSITTIKNWKAMREQSKNTSSKQMPKPIAVLQKPKDEKPATKKEPQIAYDDFVRGYWNGGTRAVDVLLLPPEIGPDIVRYVNEALKYAYEKLQ